MSTNEPKSRVPEPALVRGALVSVSAVVAVVFGFQVDSTPIEQIVTAYAAGSALVAALLIRPAVKPFEGDE